MKVDFSEIVKKGETVAVAVSGGSDSMALLCYMLSAAEELGINVAALNVEHGIRGEDSLRDTEFVKNFCAERGVKLFEYSVNAGDFSAKEKISLEQAARILRYRCFKDALENRKCDKVATAHHAADNLESVLFNLFRGTGLKGAAGIEYSRKDKIIRPFLRTEKTEIQQYIIENNIPYVTDETNFSSDYTRNFLRLNVIPQIKKIFPEAEKAVSRYSDLAANDEEFLQSQAEKILSISDGRAEILLPAHKALFGRAAVSALKSLGIEKDWEKIHIDDAYALAGKETGKTVCLPHGVIAVKEYNKIVFTRALPDYSEETLAFSVGTHNFAGQTVILKRISAAGVNLKSGLFMDESKIPQNTVIRTKRKGDVFTKFGGGTKSLSDYLTDKKIPRLARNALLLIASGKEILAIIGVAVSDKVKADADTRTLIKII